MQTTGRAITKTETSTDRRFTRHLLLTLSYSAKNFTLTLYGIKYLTLRHLCQVKTGAKVGDTN